MIRLYSLTRIYIVTASLYYLWYLAYFYFTDRYFNGINYIAFFSVYWFLAVILYFYFRYIYLITIRRIILACGWSFVNILLIDWLLKGGFHYYFFLASLLLIPFSILQVLRISAKMKYNVLGIDENGEEFEMEEEEYLKLLAKEQAEREAIKDEINNSINNSINESNKRPEGNNPE